MGDTHWLIHLSWGLSKGNNIISLCREETLGLVGGLCIIRQCHNWPGSLSDSVIVVEVYC